MNNNFIARAIHEADGSWRQQSLSDHLNNVAGKAGEFASAFWNRDWGELLGYWHDLGKYHPIWQRHIRQVTGYPLGAFENAKGQIHHTTAGAVQAMLSMKETPPARILSYILAGHHAGLPDWDPDEAGGDLVNRIYKNDELDQRDLTEILKNAEAKSFLSKPLPKSTPMGLPMQQAMQAKEDFHLWIRMLFSCLVDADFLDAGTFMKPQQMIIRGGYLSLSELTGRFNAYIAAKEQAAKDKADTALNRRRKAIREQCVQKAVLDPGFFSLTVPTGGGKTLSSMAFALEHALHHGKRRIIYAIPYTSIIEQTAKVFKYGTDIDEQIKKAKQTGQFLFGEDQVIEHHSLVEFADDDCPSKLATENWDAPLIVTTNVQLFESLFAARTSACRKLHNIAQSIIILDEVQMLPPEYLKPLLSVLRGLVAHFGVTVVLMTATLPTLEGRVGVPPNDFLGLVNVRPIVENLDELASDFNRVEFSFPDDLSETKSWEAVRDGLVQYDQVLCIVNTRADCRDLHALMPEGTIHLSALMCAAERSHIISQIKERLRRSEPLRVVSTQLVEAGVDIDFPVVYRALAGFDSIAQAAGRCNRENRLAEQGRKGKMVVFVPPKPAPLGLLRKGEDACKEVLRSCDVKSLSSHVFKSYFSQFYAKLNSVDKPRFSERLVKDAADFKFQFRTLARNFQLIDDKFYQSMVVFYQIPANDKEHTDSRKLVAMLRSKGPERWLQRKLQRFMVNVPERWMKHFLDYDMVEIIAGYWVQKAPDLYKPSIGVQIEESLITEQFYI